MAAVKGVFFLVWMGLLAGGMLLAPPVHAENTTSFTWGVLTVGDLELQLHSTRCMAATGLQNLIVTAYRRPGSSTSTSANVTGTMYKPQGGTDNLSFTSQGDGNYLNAYSFSQTGTYKLNLHATDTNYTPGDLNEYIYTQDFDFGISFLNNSFTITAGNTGTVQNYVQNSDSNAVTGLTGNIDINYPNGASFVNDGTISETGNGNYYYNFTAPATNGVYTAASSFTCGSNTDVNMSGTFTVSGASSGGTGDTGGTNGSDDGSGGGGGGGGGGSGDSIGLWSQTISIEPGALASGETLALGATERAKFIIGGGTHYLGLEAIGSHTANIVVSSTPQRATIHAGESISFELTGDAFFDLDVTLRSVEDEKAEFDLKSIHKGVSPIEAQVAGWSFAEFAEVGEPNYLNLILRNTGASGTTFLVKATISQGQENEYFDTMLTPYLEPRETIEIQFDEAYTTYVSGNHLLNIQLFTPDGGEKVGEYAKNFDIGGLLRYDVVATCLEPSVVPGREASALLALVNQGDYFQDMQFSWWVEDKKGGKIGLGSFPIALYNQEARSLVRNVLIPADAKPGEYQFKAQLKYETTEINGSCSFNVKSNEDYFTEQLQYAKTVLNQLEEIAQKKKDALPPEVFEKISELKIVLGLFENAVENKNYKNAQTLNEQAKKTLTELSNIIISEKPKGFLERINIEQLAITTASIALVVWGVLLIRAPKSKGKGMEGSPEKEKDILLELLERHTDGTAAPIHGRGMKSLLMLHENEPAPSMAEGHRRIQSLDKWTPILPEQTNAPPAGVDHLRSNIHGEMKKDLTFLQRVLGMGKPKV